MLGNVAQLVSVLGQDPDPEVVCFSLRRTSRTHLSTVATALFLRRDDELIVAGTSGFHDHELVNGAAIPMDWDYPAIRSITDGEARFIASQDLLATFGGPDPESTARLHLCTRIEDGGVVAVPILLRGRPVGVIEWYVDRPPDTTWETTSLLWVLSNVTAVWLSHPSPRRHLGAATAQEQPSPRVELTPRQVEVLRGVQRGRTNIALAALLNLSESTIKQELSKVMAALGAPSRTAAVQKAGRFGLLHRRAAAS